jgi:hypothetical protein
VPQSADRTVAAGSGGILAPMSADEVAAARAALVALPIDGTSVVPAADRLPHVTPPPVPLAGLSSPTWLASEPEANQVVTAPLEPDQPRPLAKVIDVTPWGATAATTTPSPWDRWPQWEPSAASESGAQQAAFDAGVGLRTAIAQQASYNPPGVSSANGPDDISDRSLRTHIVIDGDSLAKLADRYLDDPALGNEIYEMNRNVLANPELLPIGVELRIPERGAATDLRAELEPRNASALPASNAQATFEPVDRWLEQGADVPRAQLLQPVPLGRVD